MILLSNLILALIPLLIIIAIFVLSLIAKMKIDDVNPTYLSGLGYTWQRGPILTLNPISQSVCPPGELVLLHDDWLGTVEGCDCTMRESDAYLKVGPCSKGKNGSEKACGDVPEKQKILYKYWGDKLFCGKRLGNYLDLNIVPNGEKCNNGMKQCGIIDTFNNILCVENSQECPINKIKFFKEGNGSLENQTGSVYFDQLKQAVYSNKYTSETILGDFKIDENTPCLFPSNENIVFTPYKLSKVLDDFNTCPSNSNDGTTTDPRTYELDSMSQKSFFISNGVEDVLLGLPLFKGTDTSNIQKLYGKTTPGLNLSCRESILSKYTSESFVQTLINMNENVRFSEGKIISAFIFNCVMLGFMIVVFLVMWISSCCCNDDDSLSKVPKYYIGCLYAFGLGALVFNCTAAYIHRKLPDAHEYLLDPCSDAITSNIIIVVIDLISQVNSLTIAVSILSGVLFFIPGLFIIYDKANKDF
jgi:hypothetical protein